jgi:hypothetical protein
MQIVMVFGSVSRVRSADGGRLSRIGGVPIGL